MSLRPPKPPTDRWPPTRGTWEEGYRAGKRRLEYCIEVCEWNIDQIELTHVTSPSEILDSIAAVTTVAGIGSKLSSAALKKALLAYIKKDADEATAASLRRELSRPARHGRLPGATKTRAIPRDPATEDLLAKVKVALGITSAMLAAEVYHRMFGPPKGVRFRTRAQVRTDTAPWRDHLRDWERRERDWKTWWRGVDRKVRRLPADPRHWPSITPPRRLNYRDVGWLD